LAVQTTQTVLCAEPVILIDIQMKDRIRRFWNRRCSSVGKSRLSSLWGTSARCDTCVTELQGAAQAEHDLVGDRSTARRSSSGERGGETCIGSTHANEIATPSSPPATPPDVPAEPFESVKIDEISYPASARAECVEW